MVMRINGFSSGMDIDTIVKQLMSAQSSPLDAIMKKKQTLEWQRDNYREINSKVLAFRNLAFDMKLQTPYLSKVTSSADESIVSAKGTANATDGTYKLRITQLAESASANSSGVVTTVPEGKKVGVSDNIATVDASIASKFSLVIGGEKGTANIDLKNTDTIASFISNFNNQSGTTGVKVSFDDTLKRFFFVSTNTGAESKVELQSTDSNFLNNVLKVDGVTNHTGEELSGTKVFKTTPQDVPDLTKLVDGTLTGSQTLRIGYNSQNYDFTITSTTKVEDLINNINNDAGFRSTGIKVGLDPTTGALTFDKNKATGAITFTDMTSDDTDIVGKLGLPSQSTSESVKGTAYLSPVPPYVNPSIVINSALSSDQTFRIKYDVDGDSTAEDYNFTITKTTTIGSLVSSINNSALGKSGKVNAHLDAETGKLVLTSSDNTKHFDFSDATADGTDILGSLGLTAGVNDTNGAGDYSYSQLKNTGLNAKISYNDVLAEYASNTFMINGVTFTAKQASNTDVKVVVSQDVDSVYNSIKNLIDKYNELTGSINSQLTETKYRDFQPLTKAEREGLSDDEIKDWELKAKSGLLRNDQILSAAMNQYRTSLYESVSGLPSSDLRHLSDVGITTGSYLEKGKLNISETKLREAISQNPEQVMNLFISDDKDDKASSSDGLATRLYHLSAAIINTINEKAGTELTINDNFEMGKELNRMEERINRFNDRLSMMEDRYYKQFTAMEKAMQQLNSQSSYLLQQFGGA